jgi:hypothetical protein
MKKFAIVLCLGLLTCTAALAAESSAVNVSGFVNPMFLYQNNLKAGPGFIINDGAVYFAHKSDKVAALVDLPFAYKAADITKSASFSLAERGAQAYVDWMPYDLWTLRLGQFDAIHGFESADAKDRIFSRGGLVSGMAASTHTGFMNQFNWNKFTGRVYVANTASQGRTAGDNYEYGWQVLYTPAEWFRLNAGHRMTKIVAGTTNDMDLVLGTTFGKYLLDVEVAYNKLPGTDAGIGFLVHESYGLTDALTLAVRFEYLKKVTGLFSQMQVTAGPQYALSKALSVKTDYSFNTTKVINGGTSVKGHTVALGGVYNF